MLEREDYPAGVPCWIDLSHANAPAAADFYGGLFDWKFKDRIPADAPGHYFIAQLDGRDAAAIGSDGDDGPRRATWNTYVAVASVDDTAARVIDAGGKVVLAPVDVPHAGRMSVCTDPAGATFCLWEAKERPGATVVNEPGSWNFSNLRSDDLEAAKEFYGAIFGWTFAKLDAFDGGPDVTLVLLPGYGEFLAQRDPEIRERQAADGAPSMFADAVAWFGGFVGDAPGDDAPHWSVTFAVSDTDAVVARAEQLGGRVIDPPTDTPPVRTARLADPQGAIFTVSTYEPGSS